MIKHAGFEMNISPSTLSSPKHNPVCCTPGVGWDGEVEAEGKPLNWSSHQTLSSWDFRGKKARADGDVNPRWGFVAGCTLRRNITACLPAAQGKGAPAAMVALAHCGSLAPGHFLKVVQSIRWHIREQKAISAAGLLLLAALIASSRLSASQTDLYSLPGNFFLILFLTTAIFMLGIICRIGWKDIDHHFIKIPGSEFSSLFVLAWLRNPPRAALGVEATVVNKEKSHQYRHNFTISWMCEMWEDSPPLFCCLLMLRCMKSYFQMMKVFARSRQVVMNGIAFEFCL